MIVQPPQLAALDWVAAAAGTLARPWKVGSIVSGRVLEYLPAIRLVLQINGLKVEADPPPTGSVPRQFQARVLETGPQPVLELLGQPETNQSSPVAAALRARLPRQGGLQPLLADLSALARMPGARALPEPARAALARLEGSIADRHDMLDPDVLRDTLQRAGVQLEHTLLQRARMPERAPAMQVDYDIKAALQRLAQALQPLPKTATPVPETAEAPPPPLLRLPLQPQPRLPATPATDALALAGGLLKHAQAALSRIEIMQLDAHPSTSPQACMLEVPVRGDDGFDVLQIRIEQDGHGPDAGAEEESHWTLGFTLEPPALGAIHGTIRLHGAEVNVDLWAQHDAAVQALEEQTSVLSRLLEGSGLRLGQLRIRQGSPLRHTGLGHSLLEARA
ncbi:MAG: flagellar hook-length control protein FliK [Rhodanobacteraceae bacterium]